MEVRIRTVNEVARHLQSSSAIPEQIARGLLMRIEDDEQLHPQSKYELQSRIQNKMSKLKGMIDREKQERSLRGDEFIMARNRYTQQLQSSLSVVSS